MELHPTRPSWLPVPDFALKADPWRRFWMGEGCFQLKPRNSVDNVTGIRLHVQGKHPWFFFLLVSLIQGKGIESKQNSKQKRIRIDRSYKNRDYYHIGSLLDRFEGLKYGQQFNPPKLTDPIQSNFN
ncbi:unnamed protein product [Prunus armeniaca]